MKKYLSLAIFYNIFGYSLRENGLEQSDRVSSNIKTRHAGVEMVKLSTIITKASLD